MRFDDDLVDNSSGALETLVSDVWEPTGHLTDGGRSAWACLSDTTPRRHRTRQT